MLRPRMNSTRRVVLLTAVFASFLTFISVDLSTLRIENSIPKTPPTGFIDSPDARRPRVRETKQKPQQSKKKIFEDEDEADFGVSDDSHSHMESVNEVDGDGQLLAKSDADEELVNHVLTGIAPSATRTTTLEGKNREFGVRHGHRSPHVEARKRKKGARDRTAKLDNPVIEDVESDLIPFNESFVREAYRKTSRIEMEAEYFRFEDDFGLIDTGWSDDEVIFALQRLIDIYAQANIRIRLRRKEALSRVKLSRERSLAYWYYVDYPRGNIMSTERAEHKEFMKRVIGEDLIKLFEGIDRERQGLFDWIAGWPEERTPWENENVVGMYPSFYYFFMNGGGEGGCMRFRTGDCNTPKVLKGMNGLRVKCYHLDVSPKKERQVEVPIVRSWERYNFTADMAIRLVAHEMGHAMTLRHPNKGCVQVQDWEKGNLMSQVMTMAGVGKTCRVIGWPWFAAKATYLTDDQIETARQAVKKDLRETPTVAGCSRVGKTVEVIATTCEFRRYTLIGFFGASIAATKDGTVMRVRWKSTQDFAEADKLKISVGHFDDISGEWKESESEIVRPHTMGAAIHQEHDVELPIKAGETIAVLLNSRREGVSLSPQTHTYADADALAVDVVGDVPMSKRDHPTVNQVMSTVDANTIYPKVVPKAIGVDSNKVMTKESGWISAQRCAEWILNYDMV